MSIAFLILSISSSIITTSDASMAESLPIFPIEKPIFDATIEGASLIPSPTNPTKFSSFSISFNNSLYFWFGNNSYFTSSIFTFSAISSAISFLSPVNIIVFILCFFNSEITFLELDLILSLSSILAIILLSTFKNIPFSTWLDLTNSALPILTLVESIS